jgi:histidine triad (HIT) family protein
MSLVDDCAFCKIIKGEIPAAKLYEDERVLVFLDIAPFNFGHALVLPKLHHHSVTTLPSEYLSAMMNVAAQVAPAIMRVTNAEGFNFFLNNGSVAGQVVPHVHLHILPRHVNDEVLIQAADKKYDSPAAMQALAADIAAKVGI